MHTKAELVEVLRARGLRLSKRLGQHYLIDPAMSRRLVDSCALAPDALVVEVGAGLGALTDLLAGRAKRVVALEVDRAIAALLADHLRSSPNVEVRCEDALAVSWAQWSGCIVVGLIPYLITSPLLVQICEASAHIKEVWLSVQQEVADRMSARPGTKAYGRLTVLLQYRWDVTRVIRLPRRLFFPEPKVDSAWIHLAPRSSPVVRVHDERAFFELVRVAFSQRRKTLANCLRAWPTLARADIPALLEVAKLPLNIRGEALSLEQFATLANLLSTEHVTHN